MLNQFDIHDIINHLQLHPELIVIDEDIRSRCTQIARSLIDNTAISLINHSIPPEVIMNMFQQSHEFFHLPLTEKLSCTSKDKARRGYNELNCENFATLIGEKGKPNDLVEKFRIGPLTTNDEKINDPEYYQCKEGRIHFYENIWPSQLDEFQGVGTEYYRQLEILSEYLLQILEIGLDLPRNYFIDCLTGHTSILSMNYYPHLTKEDLSNMNDDIERRYIDDDHDHIMRVAGHTDVSLLTIVIQSVRPLADNALLGDSCGLELYHPNHNKWYNLTDCTRDKFEYIVHAGDFLQDWSRNQFKSTLHRVVSSVTNPIDRYSTAYFLAPRYDTIMKRFSHHTSVCEDKDEYDGISYAKWRQLRIKRALKSK